MLVHVYGTMVLTEPWNPYMPVLWWTLTLVALWAVVCDDLPMLPVAVFAASFCLQTHISYAGLVAGFAVAALAVFGVRAVRLRGDRPALRRLVGWSGVALVLGVVLWLPPIIDQATGDPGNMSIVVGHFLDPAEEPIGVERGAELFAVHLDPWRFVAGEQDISGSRVPAALFVLLWAAAAVATWRLVPRTAGHRSALLRLHAVIAVGLVLGFVSSTRILGFVWFYLTLWAWSLTMLMCVAIVWAVVLVVAARDRVPAVAPRLGLAAIVAVLVGWTAWFAVDARDAEPTQAVYSTILSEFTDVTTEAIDAGALAGWRTRRALHRHVDRRRSTWARPATASSTSSNDGVTTPGPRRSTSRACSSHRIVDPDDATGEIHISFGPDIERWDEMPGFERLAWVDPRTDEQLAAYDEARTTTIEELRAAGRDDLVPLVDRAPFQLYFNDELPEDLLTVVQVINDTGQPAAVYLGPPTTGVTAAD